MNGREVLTNARPFIEERWGRYTLINVFTGNMCALGAVMSARWSPEEVADMPYSALDDGNGAREAVEALFATLPSDFVEQERVNYGDDYADFSSRYDVIVGYNDFAGRTKEEMLALVDRAISLLDSGDAED